VLSADLEVVRAGSVAEALEVLPRLRPACVLYDLDSAGGPEGLVALRKEMPPASLVALGRAGAEDIQQSAADDLLVVPPAHPDLVQRIVIAAIGHKILKTQMVQHRRFEGVGRMAGAAAHDFNNLWSIISSYTRLVADELTRDDPLRADLEEVLTAARRGAELTRRLLDASRKARQEPEEVDLNEAVTTMLPVLAHIAGPGVKLSTDLEPALPVVLIENAAVEQALISLTSNAWDALSTGGEIGFGTARRTTGFVSLTVHDTGSGMEPEVRARAFEPFFSTKAGAAGLGLYEVSEVTREAGGRVTLQSAAGAGTEVALYFPAKTP
jgi:signal transduction histidine kinase